MTGDAAKADQQDAGKRSVIERLRARARLWWLVLLMGIGATLTVYIVVAHVLPFDTRTFVAFVAMHGPLILLPLSGLVTVHRHVAPRGVRRMVGAWAFTLWVWWAAWLTSWVAVAWDIGATFLNVPSRVVDVLFSPLWVAVVVLGAVSAWMLRRTFAAHEQTLRDGELRPRLLASTLWGILAIIFAARAAVAIPFAILDVMSNTGLRPRPGPTSAWSTMRSTLSAPWLIIGLQVGLFGTVAVLATRLKVLQDGLIFAIPYRCLTCGYDLAGLSELRCPECGGAVETAVIPPTQTASSPPPDGPTPS